MIIPILSGLVAVSDSVFIDEYVYKHRLGLIVDGLTAIIFAHFD